jgi:hypothetical protein
MVAENVESVKKIIMKAAIEENVAKVASIKWRNQCLAKSKRKCEMAIMAMAAAACCGTRSIMKIKLKNKHQ